MTIPEYIRAMLATLMLCQDHADGIQGLVAIGLIVRNRVRAGWHGGDWGKVIEAHYTYAADDWVPETLWPNLSDPLLQNVLWKVDSIYDGSEADITDGALYYGNLATASSEWFIEKIVRRPEEHPRIGTVGRLTLFR